VLNLHIGGAVKVQRFEDLEVSQEARTLVSEVYHAARENGRLAKDYRFRDQITAAAVSVMSNIAEGFSRRTNKEFTHFLFIAKGSCAEVQSLLYVALDQDYLVKEKFEPIYQQADLVARRVSRLITYLLRRTQSTQRTQGTPVRA
jgi:four helix bundle protein